jgi:hypothetical protein
VSRERRAESAGTSGAEGVLGRVLGVVAGLLDVGLRLLGLAAGLEFLVAGQLAGGLLDLADRFFGPVLDPVTHRHIRIPPARRRLPAAPPTAGVSVVYPARPAVKR